VLRQLRRIGSIDPTTSVSTSSTATPAAARPLPHRVSAPVSYAARSARAPAAPPLRRFARDRDHCVAGGVELLFRFALRRLDHQGAGDDQGEVDRRRVKAVVHQALGDIQRRDVVLLLLLVVERHLVQRGGVVRQVIVAAQSGADVIRVQHRELGDAPQAGRAHRADVRQGARTSTPKLPLKARMRPIESG